MTWRQLAAVPLSFSVSASNWTCRVGSRPLRRRARSVGGAVFRAVPPLIGDGLSFAGHIQLRLAAHLHAEFRSDAAHRPLQFVAAVDLHVSRHIFQIPRYFRRPRAARFRSRHPRQAARQLPTTPASYCRAGARPPPPSPTAGCRHAVERQRRQQAERSALRVPPGTPTRVSARPAESRRVAVPAAAIAGRCARRRRSAKRGRGRAGAETRPAPR